MSRKTNQSRRSSRHSSDPQKRNVRSGGSIGTLTEWDDERGYGFITPVKGRGKVFLHIKSFRAGVRRPVPGETVFYTLSTDDRGRPRAVDAYLTEYDEKRRPPFPHALIRKLANCWLLALVILAFGIWITDSFPAGLFIAFFINSLFTIAFYWEDKYLAQYKYWRIPEWSLHSWELFWGWPGAVVAQIAVRHKLRKKAFMALFCVCVLLNITLCWLLLHEDRIVWQQQLFFLFSGILGG